MQLGFRSFITNSRGMQIQSGSEEISVERKEEDNVSPNCSEDVQGNFLKGLPGNKHSYVRVRVTEIYIGFQIGPSDVSKGESI